MRAFLVTVGCLVAISLVTLFCGCEGPAGPAGPSGTAECAGCHNDSTAVLSRILQYNASIHATGGNFERNTTSCAPCHTHEGFVEVLATGAEETAEDIPNPSPPSCRTCHNIHTAFSWSDFGLRTSSPVVFRINGATFDMGDANLCANCHQPRTPSPMVEVGGDSVALTSRRWGPHHGPQATILAGTGGYEVPGSLPYNDSPHTTMITDGCVACHMTSPRGDQAGGHSMNMTYEYHGATEDWTAGCEDCHGSLDDFDYNGVQTEIAGLLDQLRIALEAEGILDIDGYVVSGTWSANQAGAVLNFKMVEEDRSHGVHNSHYCRALLQNALDNL